MEALFIVLGFVVVCWLIWDFRRTTNEQDRAKRRARSRRGSQSNKHTATGQTGTARQNLPPEHRDLDYILEWFESDDGQGYVLHRLRDDQRRSWQKLDPDEGLYSFYIRLDSDLGDELQSPRFAPGSPLTIREEERAGEEVLSAWDEDGETRLGWITVGDEGRVRDMWERDDDPTFTVLWERLNEDGSRKQVRALFVVGDWKIGKLEPGERLPE